MYSLNIKSGARLWQKADMITLASLTHGIAVAQTATDTAVTWAPFQNPYPLRSRIVRSHEDLKLEDSWVPSQYAKRRLIVRSREVSKPRDLYFKLSYRFETWQAHRQHCCRSACQISERSDNSKYKSRSFETLRDLTERRLFGYWDEAQYSGGVTFYTIYHNTRYSFKLQVTFAALYL